MDTNACTGHPGHNCHGQRFCTMSEALLMARPRGRQHAPLESKLCHLLSPRLFPPATSSRRRSAPACLQSH
eukprot:4579952-Pyramimonas_sp.AAC.1